MRPIDCVRDSLALCLTVALVLAGCTVNGSGRDEAAGRRAGIGLSSTSFQLLDSATLELGAVTAPADAAAVMKRRFAPSADGASNVDERTELLTDPAGGTTVVYTATGLTDDAIQAEQFVAELEPAADGTLRVTALGHRWRCWRSQAADADAWTIDPCP